jgi:hypothetical protein
MFRSGCSLAVLGCPRTLTGEGSAKRAEVTSASLWT